MKWVAAPGNWKVSELDLPRVEPAAGAALQRWCVVAGGLGLILSRLGTPERSARFPHSAALYALVRRQLRRSEPVRADAGLLVEVMHEVAETADPLTRSCLRACFHDSVGEGAADAGRAPAPAAAASTLASRPRPSSQGSSASRQSETDTSFHTDMLLQRSQALRRSVAAARRSSGAREEALPSRPGPISAA